MPADERTPHPAAPADEDGRWRTSLAVPALIMLIVVVAIGAIIVEAMQEQDRGGDALVGVRVEATSLPVTIPYRLVAGHPVIEVTLGEHGRTVPMVLDTGAPTVVTESVAAVFAGDRVGAVSATSAAGEVISSDVVVLPRLSIGDAVFRDVGAVVGALEPGNPFSCLTDSGFVGSNLMRTAVWQLDPVASTLTIAASVHDLAHIDGAAKLDFVPASELSPSPLVQLQAGDGQLGFLVDSASDAWLAVNPLDMDGLGMALPPDAPSQAVLVSTAGAPRTSEISWLGVESQIGGEERQLPIGATDLYAPGQGNLGSDFLSRFIVTIDWTEDVLYLEPVFELVPSTPRAATLGWDDGYVVDSYVMGRPGTEDLVLGAAVIAIDDEDVRGVPNAHYCARLTAVDAAHANDLTVGVGETTIDIESGAVGDFYEPLGG